MLNTQPVKIMIVDDHPPIIHSLCDFLQTVPNFEAVASAKTAEEARVLMKNSDIDLVIMDVRLKSGNGIDLTIEFNDCYPDLAILIYSGESNVELVRRAKDAGARGYLLKGADLHVIKQAIDIAMSGGFYMDPDLPERPKPRLRGETLTPREEEVMRLFGQWMTTEGISEKLKLKLSTVKTHRNNIMWKLGLNNTPELYKAAVERYGNLDDDRI